MWDKETPKDLEPISYGDDRIRELKQDLENALKIEHHFPVDNFNVKMLPKVVASNVPPENYEGRIYFNTLPNYRTFFIFNNNEWIPISNNFYTIPSDTYFVTSTSGVFINTIMLPKTYALRITNNWLTNFDFFDGDNPVNITHGHAVLNTSFKHSHNKVVDMPVSQGADADSYWLENKEKVVHNSHKHTLNITLNEVNLEHNHLLKLFSINFKYYTLRIARVFY